MTRLGLWSVVALLTATLGCAASHAEAFINAPAGLNSEAPTVRTASIMAANGTPIPSVMAFWFAWYAFHPDTQVFKAH